MYFIVTLNCTVLFDTIFVNSDANLPLFGEICRFFDQMGHFCESSRTDEKNLGVLGEEVLQL